MFDRQKYLPGRKLVCSNLIGSNNSYAFQIGGKMSWISSLLSQNKKKDKHESVSYTSRLGKTVKVDEVFHAWTSGDLNKMLEVVNLKTNPIDRHFLLQNIVNESYKLRKEKYYRDICIKHSEIHLAEFPNIVPYLKEDMDGELPRVTTFQHYATLLTEDKEYNRAIFVCKEALKYGLSDNTKSGFEGRIERIHKKTNN
jgi:hypothetical protein